MDLLRIAEEDELYKSRSESLEQLRICRFSKRIAEYVIDEKGEIDLKKATEVIEGFHPEGYGPFDSLFPVHVKQVLQLFFQKKFQLKLKQFSFPLANPWVDKLVGGTEKRDISVAFLEALLIFLRQTVGSCFATAPIILMQTNNPEFLLEDLYDLMTRGLLKRVIDGKEYKVPISIKTSGNRDFESPLLRCYEYTVASFADWKIEFYKWNMYASLGLDVKEKGGIGEAVFNFLENLLEKTNQEIQKLYEEACSAEDRYRMDETKVNENQYFISKNRFEEGQKKAKNIAEFYPFFHGELMRLFPSYFQEVFDPEMQSEVGMILEDRPAGFRLMFKHGRSDPTVWTMIYEEKEYLHALEDFFRFVEVDIGYTTEEKKLLQEVITVVIQTIWEKGFLERATLRIQGMHAKHLGDVKPLYPWAYISGGNLESLSAAYFSLKTPLTRKDFIPKTPTELCIALVEYMKELPYREAKEFEDNPLKAILMTSPVHVFLFRPGLKPFFDAWQDSGNTYTYVRDMKEPIPFADTNWNSELFAFYNNQLVRKSTFSLKPLPEQWSKFFGSGSIWTLWR